MHAHKLGSDAAGTDLVFTAKQFELIVKGGTLLSTRMGELLKKRRWMTTALLASLFGATLFFAVGALATKQFYQVSDGNGVVKRRARPNAWLYIGCVCLCLFYMLYFHYVNREVFLNCVRSFDSLVVICAAVLELLCQRYNWYIVFAQAGAWDGAEIIVLILQAIIVTIAAVQVATLDSLMVPQCRKVLLCFFFLAASTFSYMWTRFQEDAVWSDEPVRWWLVRATPKQVCLSCQLQQILFLGRGTFAYARGNLFWHITSSYELVRNRSDDVNETFVERNSQTTDLDATNQDADLTKDIVVRLCGSASSNHLATDLACGHLDCGTPRLTLDLSSELSSSSQADVECWI